MQTNYARLGHRGFTLVELLVVISIIGVLMGLLLPAVMSVQGVARQSYCLNNMKNVSLALQQYESSKNSFPGYRNASVPETTARTQATSWVPLILEQLGHGDIRREWLKKSINGSTAVTAIPNIPLLICPADGRTSGYLSYKINSGLDSSSTAKNMRFTGIALNRYSNNADVSALAVSISSIADGAANTVLIGENGYNALRKGWNACDTGTTYNSRLVYVTSGEGVNWKPSDGSGVQFGVNKNLSDTGVGKEYARPTSNHRGIATVAFCDGHARAVKDTVSYNVYKYIMCPNDSMAKSNFSGLGINTTSVSIP